MYNGIIIAGPDGTLVFASVKSGAVEIMYQTRASVLADGSVSDDDLRGHSTVLFIIVNDLDIVEKAMAGVAHNCRRAKVGGAARI